MKSLVLGTLLSVISIAALAEGPVLKCSASRSIRDGKGFVVVAEKEITSTIGQKLSAHSLGPATAKSYINAEGKIVLVLIDPEIGSSSTMTTIGSGDPVATLSLNQKNVSNFLHCDII